MTPEIVSRSDQEGIKIQYGTTIITVWDAAMPETEALLAKVIRACLQKHGSSSSGDS